MKNHSWGYRPPAGLAEFRAGEGIVTYKRLLLYWKLLQGRAPPSAGGQGTVGAFPSYMVQKGRDLGNG